ncbi:Heat shock protein Hsp20 [Nocardioides sp. PD653]|nr:Heat shock protein Hsp20 [Nocardioides sp. PD653-B2]GAW54059.1 Heat shock protein Hsp20 [Nocardioides sp. PD653]
MMSTTLQCNGQSLVNELMTWMGTAVAAPEVRVEEWTEGERRVIRADLPGIDPEKDIELTVDGGTLRLHGQRRSEEHAEHRTEIRYGSFERILPLPEGTRAEDVTAEYHDGVLTVSMPAGTAALAPRKIPVTHRELPVE